MHLYYSLQVGQEIVCLNFVLRRLFQVHRPVAQDLETLHIHICDLVCASVT